MADKKELIQSSLDKEHTSVDAASTDQEELHDEALEADLETSMQVLKGGNTSMNEVCIYTSPPVGCTQSLKP